MSWVNGGSERSELLNEWINKCEQMGRKNTMFYISGTVVLQPILDIQAFIVLKTIKNGSILVNCYLEKVKT